MLEKILVSDGFWAAVSTSIFWFTIAFLMAYMWPTLKKLFDRDSVKLKIGESEISFEKAADQLGKYVTELQSRLAALEEKSERGFKRIDTEKEKTIKLKRILWVDDFPENNAFLVERLRDVGADVDLATDTSSGIKMFTALDHALIISDMGRVEKGEDNPLAGIDLINAVRRLNEEVPVLIFAGKRGVALKDKILKAGASGVTSSGIDLLKMINDAIGIEP